MYGQPSLKVFGFEQECLPGTVAANTKDENGNPVKKAATQKNYFIYLSLKQSDSIAPEHVFIHGSPFSVEPGTVNATPVEHVDHNVRGQPAKTILVPKTTDKVIKLKVAGSLQLKQTPAIRKLITNNDVVIAYTWKSEKYFVVLKKIKKLDPVLNE